MERMYHVIVINNKTKEKTYMTKDPVKHETAMVILSKITKYNWRTETIEEA